MIEIARREKCHGIPLEEAQRLLRSALSPLAPARVALPDAHGRVAACAVAAPRDLPPFARAAVDGFAVAARDLAGATPEGPVTLPVVLDVEPGRRAAEPLRPGAAARILTGAPLPDGADAVVMLEDVAVRDGMILVPGPIASGKHAGRRGEDAHGGDELVSAGRRLRADDVALLAASGVSTVLVHPAPRLVVFSTGDELLDPLAAHEADDARIFDANSFLLEALARREGALVRRGGIIPDGHEPIARALREVEDVEVTVTTGAASAGRLDVVPDVVAELGELLVHGVALRPGHPVGFGRIGGRVHFALPGNPVAAWVGFRLFVRPALRLLSGDSPAAAFGADHTFSAVLATSYASVRGRTDVVRVRRGPGGTVEPIGASGASRLTTLTRADGYFVVPPDVESIPEGAEVEVEPIE